MRADLFKEMVTGGKVHVFSVYTDFGAYRRIKWTINAIARLAGQRWQCSSEMWKLDSLLANAPMKRMLAHDGANADVLIAVIGSLEHPRPELIEWLNSLPPREPHQPGLMIGLLGDEENEVDELDWTAKELIHCARRMNRKFIWHWIGHHTMDGTDWLAEGVEMLVAQKQQVVPERIIFQEAVAAV